MAYSHIAACKCNFYPRSPCGERLSRAKRHAIHIIFLSTLSLRRATYPAGRCTHPAGISIHALLAESDDRPRAGGQKAPISIHALLAESDFRFSVFDFLNLPFLSTLSLRRATRLPTALRTPHHKFLSTLSLRRATESSEDANNSSNNFYPRSPCGERRPGRI